MTRNTSGKKKKRRYSRGEVNRLIDSLFHPLFDHSSAFMAVDVALHGLVEQNPPETIKKFVGYTLPEIVKKPSRASSTLALKSISAATLAPLSNVSITVDGDNGEGFVMRVLVKRAIHCQD